MLGPNICWRPSNICWSPSTYVGILIIESNAEQKNPIYTAAHKFSELGLKSSLISIALATMAQLRAAGNSSASSVQGAMFGGRGRFSGSHARIVSMSAHNTTKGAARIVVTNDPERAGPARDAWAMLDGLASPAPPAAAPEHPFVRAGLHEVADIEREHGYAAHAEKFGAHAKKQSLLCFATEFDQVRSVLALQPARTKRGNATAYPTLEPSRPVNVAHSYRMVCLAHDYMLEQATRTMLWSKGPDKVWALLQAQSNAQSAWLRTMLMHGVITPEELMDQSNAGLLHTYQKTVTAKNVTRAIKAVELWFTDRASGCHGMLSRMCTALHTNNLLLHELHGEDKAVPLPGESTCVQQCGSAAVRQCGNEHTLPHFHTFTLPHFFTFTVLAVWQYGSVEMSTHFHTSTLLHFHSSGSMAVWQCGNEHTLPHFHTSSLSQFWQCGSMAVWK